MRVALLLNLAILLGCTAVSNKPCTQNFERYASFESPDKSYSIVVCRDRQAGSSAPGDAGGASGILKLIDSDGFIIGKASVDMVQLVDRVEWGDHEVVVPFIATFQLAK